MIRSIKTILLWVVLLLSTQLLFSQTDSTATDGIHNKNDTINAVLLKQYHEKIAVIEAQSVADSLKEKKLVSQLNSLQTTDNLKKEELQKQLQELKGKDAERIVQKKAEIDSLRLTAKSYPVIGFFDDTLFNIYSRLGSFSPGERAEAISNRIKKLGENISFKPDSLILAEAENSIDISFKETVVMSITENDALWNNAGRNELAERYRKIIGDKIAQYQSETSFGTLAKEIGTALLVIFIIALFIYYAIKFFKWTAKKIQEQKDKSIKGINIKTYTLFDAQRQVNALLSANTFLKWVVILLVVYLALPLLFGIFPWTKDFAEILIGYILTPVKKMASGLWNYLPDLITIAVIVFVFSYVLKGIHFLKTEIEKGKLHITGFYPDWANPTYQIVRVLVYAFMLVVIFPYLPGSDSPIFKGVSVFLGFLFTFGSAGSLSNVIAGLVLTYMRLFKIGDRVRVGEVFGDVIEKSMLVTRIKTTKNEIISIPNSTIMSSHTINYSSEAPKDGLIMHTTVTIGYDVPWKNMHQALIDAALKTNMIMQEPKPFVLQTSLDDYYVSYQLNAYTREPNRQARIYSELHQNIQDVCNERGIEIMSPHYRAQRDGSASTIPASYTEKKADNES